MRIKLKTQQKIWPLRLCPIWENAPGKPTNNMGANIRIQQTNDLSRTNNIRTNKSKTTIKKTEKKNKCKKNKNKRKTEETE